jgi:hypothetical protein
MKSSTKHSWMQSMLLTKQIPLTGSNKFVCRWIIIDKSIDAHIDMCGLQNDIDNEQKQTNTGIQHYLFDKLFYKICTHNL